LITLTSSHIFASDLGHQNARPSQAQRTPAHRGDYVCYTTSFKEPLSPAYRLQEESLGMAYIRLLIMSPVQNFLFLIKNFLVVITKLIEPRHYHEAMKDPRWREATIEEIQALKKNVTWTL